MRVIVVAYGAPVSGMPDTKQEKFGARAFAAQSTLAVGSAAVGSLLTAALAGPLPTWALAILGVGGSLFAIFILVLACRFAVAWFTPRLRRKRANSEIGTEIDALIVGLLEATSPSFTRGVANIFHRLLQAGFIDGNSASAFNTYLMTLSRWTQVTRDQLRDGTLSPLAAFTVLSDPLAAYVDLCNTVNRLVEARMQNNSDGGLHPSAVGAMKRDWHGIATFANESANLYRTVARRVNARLKDNRVRVYFDAVADWP